MKVNHYPRPNEAPLEINYHNPSNKPKKVYPYELLQSQKLVNRLRDELTHSKVKYTGKNLIRIELPAEFKYLEYITQAALQQMDLPFDKYEFIDGILDAQFNNLPAKYTIYDPLNTALKITRFLCTDREGFNLMPESASNSDPEFVIRVNSTAYRFCCYLARIMNDVEPIGLKKDYLCVGYDEYALYFQLPDDPRR